MRSAVMPIFCILSIAFIPSFAQSDLCPDGTRAEVNGLDITCIPISDIDRTCPYGTYHGVDNQGNSVCRDVDTNQIVDPSTGFIYDSQTGDMIFEDGQIDNVIIGFIVLVITVGIIVKLSKSKSSKSETQIRKSWTESDKEKIRIRQSGKCTMCNRPPPRWEYDHKDGNHNNNLSNCQGLCPNCHSTKTYG